jgi:hypothetical protein
MSVERQSGPNPMSNEFANIVKGLAGSATSEERKVWEMGSVELAFKGQIGRKIAHWHREGLGRIVGLPSVNGTGNRIEQFVDKTLAYDGFMYVMPLTSDDVPPSARKVALVIPNETDYDVAIAIPMSKNLGSAELRDKINETTASKFVSNYTPSEKPYIFSARWNPANETSTLRALITSQEKFSMRILFVAETDDTKRNTINELEKIARSLKQERVKGLKQNTIWKGEEAA